MDESQGPIDVLALEYFSINQHAFKGTVGALFGIALLSVLVRAAIRFRTQRRLSLDDYLLFIAAVFLIATTGMAYRLCDGFYVSTAVQKDPTIYFQITPQQANLVLQNSLEENIFLVFAWTATFFVKFSFLAFFKQMIWRLDRIQYYYWGVVALTVLSYMFLVSEAFILCHDFGIESLKCFQSSKNTLYISMTGLITSLDILTDILIVSIPITVLRRAKIRTSQKISLGMFLSLSLFMVCLAVIRISKIHGIAGVDVVWEFFWQYMESTVAVLMGSLTVMRSLLIYQTKGGNSPHDKVAVAGPRSHGQNTWRLRFLRRHREQIDLESQDELPEVPAATLTGLRTFIRRNNRDPGLDTQATSTALSQQNTMVEDNESHQLLSGKPLSNENSQLAVHEDIKSQEQWKQGDQRGYQNSLPIGDQGTSLQENTHCLADCSNNS
ncbi:hypothetical protein F4810DRAFT_528487 [Camillea tinctor]|nr:hypothetical protein F4810DRAFT_528487 [Camillea tinctor]